VLMWWSYIALGRGVHSSSLQRIVHVLDEVHSLERVDAEAADGRQQRHRQTSTALSGDEARGFGLQI
jgi:hypothetical protein